MDDNFMILGNIAVTRHSMPIQFTHKRSMDRHENHVLHLNNHLEVYIYVKGNHKYIVENRIYELKRGDIILINPREVHKALPTEPCQYERFYLLIDEHCFDGFAYNPLKILLQSSPDTSNLISPSPQVREQILQLLYGISDCFARKQNRQTQALGSVLQLLDICNQQRVQEVPSANYTASVPELLEKILSYVAENTATIQYTTQIAHALGMSPQYLSSYFSKHIGTSLSVYIQTKKIALAKELLSKGADVTAACFDSGFNDCSYFIRVFKKQVGVTPLHYRRKMQKN